MLRDLQFLPLALSLSGSIAFAQAPPLGAATATTLTATVVSVDAPAHTVEVVTGVGLALRVVKLSWNEDTRIKVAGVAAPVSALKPGNVVRVDYTKSESGNLAKTIETLPAGVAGGGR